MVALSLMIEGQDGLTWPHWKHLVADAEALGFAGLFRSDHYTNPSPPDKPSLEMVVSLTYAADHTNRIHFGPLVAPLSFREPTLLARQAAALDDLSGGRMILGLGAGWTEREHTLFGHELGDTTTRMTRFEEGLEVITRLLRSDEPVTYEGRFFQLRGATLLPRPVRPGGPRILIGGNGLKRSLPLAARYADVWNADMLALEQFRACSRRLDDLLDQAGRPHRAVQRTLMTHLTLVRDGADLERQVAPRRQQQPAMFAGKSADEIAEALWTEHGFILGTPERVIERIRAFADAGVEELMLQWLDPDDRDGLRLFAEAVMPAVT